MASQVTVFVENRPGRISRIARVLADQDINIRAITISDMGEYGLINIICNDPDRAENILSQKGYSVSRK
ncbi:MAG: ACT domain-containing protein, partial [Spirochaetota bacterium]